MWLLNLVAAEDVVPAAPPEIPYETIGIVLVALVTGLTGIIVALIQRGKKASTTPATVPPVTAPVFVISKEDWEKVRDGVTRLLSQFETFKSSYDHHERWTTGEVRELDNEINRIKGHLGI